MSKLQIYTRNANLFTVFWIIWCFPQIRKSLYYEKTFFNHKNLTQNHYKYTFWVQNELIVHNLHFRTRFCGNLAKICSCYWKIMKIHRNHIYLTKCQKLTTNYWHLLKCELLLNMYGENCIQDANILSAPAP